MGLISTTRSVARFGSRRGTRTARRLRRVAGIDDLRAVAERRLPAGIFDYIDGGAEDERTLAANVGAFREVVFEPRVLRDVSNIDTSTEFLGAPLSMPVMLSPTGFTRIAHSQGELSAARAASRWSIPYCLSTLSTRSIEEVAQVCDGPKWFQVYVWRDKAMLADMLARAAHQGYGAIMLTVDTAVLGKRERDVRRGFTLPPTLGVSTMLDGITHPAWLWDFLTHGPITFSNVARSGGFDAGTAVTLSDFIAEQFDPALSWDDIDWFRAHWNGPILVKGIQSAEDAAIAVRRGIDGIGVSNHGGRQLDRAPASLDILRAVADRVGGAVPIVVDGGIRRGADIVAALAHGATLCGIGRAYLYGLGAAGEAGVDKALEVLRDEMVRTMSLLGVSRIDQIDSSVIAGGPR